MLLRYTLAWVPMVMLAILNGLVRELTYGKRMTELRAHQVATVTGLVVFGAYIFALTRIWRMESFGQALSIGIIWLVLTVSFEFLFGRFVAGHTWEKLLLDYNIFAGRLWLLFLVWITVAPCVFYLLNG
jgi:hypothetical protein